MGHQRSNYSCEPYSQGFDYAFKMRDMNTQDTPINPYSEDDMESHDAFNDGYRDGMYTAIFHNTNFNEGI